jgi:hypothetical protein
MIVELELNFRDDHGDSPLVYSLASPDGWVPTGGAIFFEKKNGEFARFTFRIENGEDEPKMIVLEEAPEE